MNADTTFEMKRLLKWGSWVVLVLGAFLALEALNAFKDLRADNPVYNSISVTGQGEAVSVPDVAEFSFTVTEDSKSVSDAQSGVTTKMNTILADLKALKIEDKDIKTIDYTVWPKYIYQGGVCTANICPPSRQIADGYTVNHTVQIKVRKTDDAGKALSAVGAKGAANVSSLSFTTDDPDKALVEARGKAVEDAKAKAEDLAKHLGVRIVRVVGYYDNAPGSYPMYEGGMGGTTISKSADMVAPTLPSGENKVITSVTINYEIK